MTTFLSRLLGHREAKARTVRERLAELVRAIAEGRDDQEPAAVEELLALARWDDAMLTRAVELERERLALGSAAAELPRRRADLARLVAEVESESVTLARQEEAIRERRAELDQRLGLARSKVALAEGSAQKLRDVNKGLRSMLDPKGLERETEAKAAAKAATSEIGKVERETADLSERLRESRGALLALVAERREHRGDPTPRERELASHVERLEGELGRLMQRKRDLEAARAEAERNLQPST